MNSSCLLLERFARRLLGSGAELSLVMAFVTVYSDHYRAHPIYPNPPFLPDKGWADLKGTWLQEGGEMPEVTWTDEQKAAFLRRANRDFFWTSTYTNDFCNNITPENRPWPIRKLRGKKLQCPCPGEPEAVQDSEGKHKDDSTRREDERKAAKKKSDKESELMKAMRDIFERDKSRRVKKPLKTARRILGYGSPYNYQCGITIYQQDIGRPGYIYMRDNLVKCPEKINGRLPFNETVFY